MRCVAAHLSRHIPLLLSRHGRRRLKLLAEARDQTDLPIVTEVTSPELVPLVSDYADVLQIGARNMQNTLCSKRWA